MAFIIEELVHPYLYELLFSQAEVENFSFHASCPSCESKLEPDHLLSLGQSEWIQCVKIVQCCTCQLIYYRNPPSEEFITSFYQKVWNKSVGEHQKKSKTFNEKRSPRIAQLLSDLGYEEKDKPCLDVGCGIGKLLAGLQDAGFSNLWGVEMSAHRASISQSRFPGRVFSGGYKSIPKGQRFQVIFSNHVMEHVHHPADFFFQIAGHLEKDGIIILTVPNAWEESILNQVLFLPHLHSFCGKSLEVLGEKNGFSCLYWKRARWEELTVIYFRGAEYRNLKTELFFQPSEVPMKTEGSQIERMQFPWKMLMGGQEAYWTLQRSPNNSFSRRHGFAPLNRQEVFLIRFHNALARATSKLTFNKMRLSALDHKGFVRIRNEEPIDKEAIPIIGVPGNKAVFHVK